MGDQEIDKLISRACCGVMKAMLRREVVKIWHDQLVINVRMNNPVASNFVSAIKFCPTCGMSTSRIW